MADVAEADEGLVYSMIMLRSKPTHHKLTIPTIFLPKHHQKRTPLRLVNQTLIPPTSQHHQMMFLEQFICMLGGPVPLSHANLADVDYEFVRVGEAFGLFDDLLHVGGVGDLVVGDV